MKLTIDDLFKYSVVLVNNSEEESRFLSRWTSTNLPRPVTMHGYTMRIGTYSELKGTRIQSRLVNVAFSHLAAVKMAKTLNWPFIFILEHTALPVNHIHDKLNILFPQIPEDTSVLKLGRTNVIPDTQNFSIRGFSEERTFGAYAYIVFSRYYDQYETIFNYIDATPDYKLINKCNDANKDYRILSSIDILFINDVYFNK